MVMRKDATTGSEAMGEAVMRRASDGKLFSTVVCYYCEPQYYCYQ
jgi:hypothetical protein